MTHRADHEEIGGASAADYAGDHDQGHGRNGVDEALLLIDKYPTHYLPEVGRQVMGRGGGIDYHVPTRLPIPGEDTEAMFRRLVAFSFAVGRQYRADGGRASIEEAIRTAQDVGDRRGMSHPVGMSSEVEFAPVSVSEPLTGKKFELGRLPAPTARFAEPAVQAAADIGPYFTPAAPLFAARDIAAGLKHGDPTELATAAFGAPGKYAKAALVGASALMPDEAQAGVVDKALQVARRLTPSGMYSPSAAAVEAGMKQEKGPASQMLGALRNLPGVKPEELHWSGVHSAFQPNEVVTRQQIMDYLHTNLPKVEETVLRNPSEEKLDVADAAVRAAIRAHNEAQAVPRYYAHNPERSYASSFFPTEEEAASHMATLPEGIRSGASVTAQEPRTLDVYDVMRRLHAGEFPTNLPFSVTRPALNLIDERSALEAASNEFSPKFSEYAIPGGKNYREVLMRLPSWQPNIEEKYGRYGFVGPEGKFRDYWTRAEAEQAARSMKRTSGQFTSSHWNEPDVLGHLRMSDRTGPEGEKILHLEELQSDWGQQGRKKGFKQPISAEEESEYQKLHGMMGSDRTEAQQDRLDQLIERMKASERGAPVAPYVASPEGKHTTSWVDLGLKRALREAAEGGYSKLVLTPGEEQAARYDLSKHLKNVAYDPEEKTLSYVAHNSNRGWQNVPGDVEPHELENHIGKEAAERLLASEPHPLSGNYVLTDEDLKVGGEGMKKFYDKMLPAQLNKLLDKLDKQSKVELGSHPLPQGHGEGEVRGHALTITPELREAILRGLPAFAQGGEVEREHFDKGGIAAALKAAARAAEEAGKRIPIERAREMVASPFSENPESVQNALKYAQSLRVPQGEERLPGSFYNVKQTRPVSEVTSTVEDIPGVKTKEINPMSWEDIVRQYTGATMFNVAGDRSNLGRLTHINDQKLAWPVDLHAGAKYMLEPNEEMVWSNNPAHATGFQKAIAEAAKRGPVIGAYHPMGVQSVDSSHNMIDTLLAQIGRGEIDRKEMRAVDEMLRRGAQADKDKVQLAIEAMQKWPGLENARESSEFARGLEGTRRSEIAKFLDKAPFLKRGFPAVGETRVAITDPALRDVPGNMLGHRIVEFDPNTLAPKKELAFTHSTYTSPTAGRYVGDVPLVQTQYAMPEVERDIMTKLAKGDRVVHPYSTDPLGRSSWRKSFETRKLGQEVNQEMLDSIMMGLERQSKYGLAEGGSVIDGALDVISNLPQNAEAETSA